MQHLKAESVIQTYINPERNNNKQTEQPNVDRTDVPKWNKLNALVECNVNGEKHLCQFPILEYIFWLI